MNPGLSVSRVGGNAQIPAMKNVAGTFKLLYSQYRELAGFAQFGSDLDADTRERLAQGERIVEVLKQGRGRPVPVEKQTAILYAVVNGLLAAVPLEEIRRFEQGLYFFLDEEEEARRAVNHIRTEGTLDVKTEESLKRVLEMYTAHFLEEMQERWKAYGSRDEGGKTENTEH